MIGRNCRCDRMMVLSLIGFIGRYGCIIDGCGSKSIEKTAPKSYHRSFIRMAYQSHCQHMQNRLPRVGLGFSRMKWLTPISYPSSRCPNNSWIAQFLAPKNREISKTLGFEDPTLSCKNRIKPPLMSKGVNMILSVHAWKRTNKNPPKNDCLRCCFLFQKRPEFQVSCF